MAENILAKLLVQISANNADFVKGVNQSQKQLANFTSGLTKVAGAVGIAFGAEQVISFARELSNLSGQAKGVENAFDRLPDSALLMEALKDATHDTVSELELMKRAVQAQNFNISLEQLPRLLEFATLRAQQTGQSIDYLVDSIVTGIGRKSPLILDNLGISAAKLSEEFKRTGDFSAAVGKIVDEELSKMPGFLDTAATGAAHTNAEFVNMKRVLGDVLNEVFLLEEGSSDLGDAIAGLTKFIRENQVVLETWLKGVFLVPRTLIKIAGEAANLFKSAEEPLETLEQKTKAIAATVKAAFDSGNVEAYIKALDQNIYREEIIAAIRAKQAEGTKEEIRTIGFLKEQLELLQRDQLSLTGTALAGANQRIKAIQEEIKALQQLGIESAKSIAPEPVRIPIEFELPEIDTAALLDAVNTINGGIQIQPVDFLGDELVDATAQMDGIIAKMQETRAAAVDTMLGITSSVSDSINALITGQQTATQALANVTLDVIDLFLKQALAAAIANAVKFGGPVPVGIVLAGVAIGAVRALFNKNVGKGGGGGGSAGGGLSGAGRGVRESQTREQGVRFEFGTTEFKFNGRELVAAIKDQEFRSNG